MNTAGYTQIVTGVKMPIDILFFLLGFVLGKAYLEWVPEEARSLEALLIRCIGLVIVFGCVAVLGRSRR